jgi:hypothetical protein
MLKLLYLQQNLYFPLLLPARLQANREGIANSIEDKAMDFIS